MKTDLIEYHREAATLARHPWFGENPPAGGKVAEFHERAVAWLESLDQPASIPTDERLAETGAFGTSK